MNFRSFLLPAPLRKIVLQRIAHKSKASYEYTTKKLQQTEQDQRNQEEFRQERVFWRNTSIPGTTSFSKLFGCDLSLTLIQSRIHINYLVLKRKFSSSLTLKQANINRRNED